MPLCSLRHTNGCKMLAVPLRIHLQPFLKEVFLLMLVHEKITHGTCSKWLVMSSYMQTYENYPPIDKKFCPTRCNCNIYVCSKKSTAAICKYYIVNLVCICDTFHNSSTYYIRHVHKGNINRIIWLGYFMLIAIKVL